MWDKIKKVFIGIINSNPFYKGRKRYVEMAISKKTGSSYIDNKIQDGIKKMGDTILQLEKCLLELRQRSVVEDTTEVRNGIDIISDRITSCRESLQELKNRYPQFFTDDVISSNKPITSALYETEAYFKISLEATIVYKRTDKHTNENLCGSVMNRIYCYEFKDGEISGIVAFDSIYQSVYNVYTPKG